MVGDPRVDHVVFTGSVYGGHRIQRRRGEALRRTSGSSSGGNDPAYVAADCDFEKTVENIVDGAIYNAGQSCCAVERVYVHRSLYDRFVEACEPLVARTCSAIPTSDDDHARPHRAAEPPGRARGIGRATPRRRAPRLVRAASARRSSGRGRFFEATLLADARREMA